MVSCVLCLQQHFDCALLSLGEGEESTFRSVISDICLSFPMRVRGIETRRECAAECNRLYNNIKKKHKKILAYRLKNIFAPVIIMQDINNYVILNKPEF